MTARHTYVVVKLTVPETVGRQPEAIDEWLANVSYDIRDESAPASPRKVAAEVVATDFDF